MSIRTAIVGYGRSAVEMHVPFIEKLPEFELSAVYDTNPEALKSAHQRSGCKTYDNYDRILADNDLDLVVILTRNNSHANIACDFLYAGKNVLITKPWALNCQEAGRIISAARKSGKLAMPWLPSRWGFDLKKLKEIVAGGEIGNIFQITRSHFTFGKRVDWQTLKEFGGGYLLNWGPHLVDQPMQLIGERVSSVYGEMKQIINTGTAEDMFHTLLKTENGVTIVVEFNIGTEHLPNWVVRGDKGTIYVTGDKMEIHKVSHPDVIDPSVYRSDFRLDIQEITLDGECFGDHEVIYQHIARAMSGKEPYAVTLDSAYELTRVLDAVRASSESNSVVKL